MTCNIPILATIQDNSVRFLFYFISILFCLTNKHLFMFRYRVFVCSGKKVTTVIVASDVALKWNQKTMLVAHNPPPPH